MSNKNLYSSPYTGHGAPIQRQLRAVVIQVYPETYTCDARAESGETFRGLPLPYLKQDPFGPGGEVEIPRTGIQVTLQIGLGFPYIRDILPCSRDANAGADKTYSLSENEATLPTASTSGYANYRGKMPKNLVQGDWLRIGNYGQYFGLFDGGVVSMFATPFAQVRATSQNDTLQLFGKNLELYTGFGTAKFTDSNGKTQFTLEGGTDTTLETGYGQANKTIKLRYDPQGYAFELLDRIGQSRYAHTVDPGGNDSEYTAGNKRFECGGNMEMFFENRTTTVRSGYDNLTVEGNVEHTIGGAFSQTVSQNMIQGIMGNRTDIVDRGYRMSAGRYLELLASGNVTKPGMNPAMLINTANGPFVIELDKPGSGIPNPKSGFKVKVNSPGASVDFTTTLGDFIVNTAKPGGVKLGANDGNTAFHAVLFEMLQKYLKSLTFWLDMHVHTATAPGSPTTPAVVPSTPILEGLVTPMKSLRVTYGA